MLAGVRTTSPELALDVRIGELPRAIDNADLLRQVWVNLLDNAVKYSRRRSVAIVEVDG